MAEKEEWIDNFITHLENLYQNKDRGALAALRRGQGSPPGTVAAVYSVVLPWLPRSPWTEKAGYVIGSLFALHPDPGGKGNLGTAFYTLKQQDKFSESMEKRFTALLGCHADDLPDYLRQVVSLLKSKGISVNWRQLLKDILSWDNETRYVQQQWAREFWRGKPLVEKMGNEDSNILVNKLEEN